MPQAASHQVSLNDVPLFDI